MCASVKENRAHKHDRVHTCECYVCVCTTVTTFDTVDVIIAVNQNISVHFSSIYLHNSNHDAASFSFKNLLWLSGN